MKVHLKKRLMSLLLACVTAAGLVIPVSASELTFSDVPSDHWAYQHIMDMTGKGLFKGTTTPVNGVGTFAPDIIMSRAEFITVLGGWLFADQLSTVERPDNAPWWYSYYQVALNNGILKSGELDNGAMELSMSRQEAAVLLARVSQALGMVPEQSVGIGGIADWYMIDGGYWKGVDLAYSLGLINGVDAAGTFAPNGTLTRAQAATMVSNLLGKAEEYATGPDQFDASLIQVACSMVPEPADNGIEVVAHYTDWNPDTMKKTLEFVERMCSGELCPPGRDPVQLTYRFQELGVKGPGWSEGEMAYRISVTRPLDDITVVSQIFVFPMFPPFVLPPTTKVSVSLIPLGDPYWGPIYYRLCDLFLQETVSDEIRTIALAMFKDIHERAEAAYATNDPEIISDYEDWLYRMGEYGDRYNSYKIAEGYSLYVGTNLSIAENIPGEMDNGLTGQVSDFEWFNEANKPK